MNENNLLLANLIATFHLIIILFILFAPFCNIPAIIFLHFVFGLSLLVHWINNQNICSLSLIESKLRGINYTQSYTHKFIAPVYDISESDWSTFCYVITIVLMFVSIYALYTSQRIKNMKIYYKNAKNELLKQNGGSELTWNESIPIYRNCLVYLI